MKHTKAAIHLLQQLIATPSLSRQEEETANILTRFFSDRAIPVHRQDNNIWVKSKHQDSEKPVLLLNSHHDTVKPAAGWKREPFLPTMEGKQLFGLGSNDAGGPLVSLIAAFLHFYERENLPYNIILAATAEEEISGPKGIASILPELGPIELGIVGEPTKMQMAIAEKGLMVVDGEAHGKSGHAAREEGINALYIALDDIRNIRDFHFDKVSDLLGPVKASVTKIEGGTQHNVVPDRCHFLIDVRTNELYSNEEVFNILQDQVKSTLKARSYRLNSSRINREHPLIKAGQSLGRHYFGSPTLSDQALMSFSTLKMGPGDSARSHTADEYIFTDEIEEGIEIYCALLESFFNAKGS